MSRRGEDQDARRLQPLVEGEVYRGGDVVSQMINVRYMQLFEDCIMQFKTKQHRAEGKTGKTFFLDGTCTVSVVYEEDMMLRPKGTSTISALVMSSYEKKHLHVFTIRWIMSHQHYRSTDHLILGFSNASEAVKWRDAIQRCIEKLPAKKTPRDGGDARSTDTSYIDRQMSIDSNAASASGLYTASSRDSSPLGQKQSAASKQTPAVDEKGECESGINPEWLENAAWPSKWVSESFYNGITVYREEEEDGGAYMCHTVIRASPLEVFEAVQKFEVGFNSALTNITVLETFKSDNTQIIHCNINAKGWLVPFFGPRDLVMQRSWRVEDDGTHVVTLNSVEHPLCPPPKPKSGLSWFTSPVRAQVIAAGFTIAPLKPNFLPPDVDPVNSPESLLTIVMRVDVGGCISWFGSAARWLENMWMWPMVSSLAGVRDRMEQRRFVGTCLLLDADGQLSQQPSGESQRAENQHGASASRPSVDLHQRRASLAVEAPLGPVKYSADLVMDRKYWNYPGAADYKVRGKNYLMDRKKVLSREPMFKLHSLFLLKLDKPMEDMARFLLPPSAPGFTFVVNIMIPGNDHLVVFWRSNKRTTEDDDDDGPATPFNTSLARFLFGDGPTFDAQRNNTFKLIPNVVEGSWVIKQSVGATPVLLGNKLRQVYHKGPNYFEVDIDIASSRAARSVVGLVASTTKTVVVNLGILMEGHKEDELPERLLGTVQLNKIDMDKATRLTTQQLD
eukprot:CAMPEP_0177595280 /NCGR_PEP_ID=MMETSP0419_2-20121207/10266_1 /TAXON_ID=582737 /ORGANISM="Tetraselmis sp., Strain GSL018" /LENGTH=731 /DNA_ID=CAMNT_0019086717 /DNA_START=95 /DNA_END=2287 /DNA_ORIENTATION=-